MTISLRAWPAWFILLAITLSGLAPAAARAAAPSADSRAGIEQEYTILPGDTLWEIAGRFDVTLEQLLAANPGLEPQQLRPGRALIIRGAAPQGARVSAVVYTVRPNDTIWDIALDHRVSVSELLAANPWADPRRLMAGQRLVIPGGDPIAEAPALTAPDGASPDGPPDADPAGSPSAPAAPAAIEAVTSLNPVLVSMAQELAAAINRARTAGGRPALAWNEALAVAAQLHALDLARRGRGGHVGSDGARLSQRVERSGYPASWSGENWANAAGAARAFQLWWNEPPGADPHVRNVMDARATEFGIGVARGAWGYYFVADFGAR